MLGFVYFFLSGFLWFFTYVRYSGPTIHFVDEEYDTGRILAQSAVRVVANDTPEELAKRVLHEVLLLDNTF